LRTDRTRTGRDQRRTLDLLIEQDALVPPLRAYEVAHVLAVVERGKPIHEAAVAQFLDLLHQLSIRIAADELDPHPLVDFSRRHQLSAYDAAYLAPAARQGLALTTHDSQLAARATTAGVQLLSGPPPPARQQASTAASVTAASAAPPLGP